VVLNTVVDEAPRSWIVDSTLQFSVSGISSIHGCLR
jgi:hypothetical protein